MFIKNENPPYTHNLTYLATQSGIYEKMTEEQKDVIDMIEPLNVEARYPTHKEKVIERVKQYSDLVRQNFRVKKIILYGSYAKGSAKKDSDIDVAVVLSSIDEDFLISESKLFRLRRNIDARIEPILLEEKNDKSGFLEEILKTGEIIYSAD